MDDFERALSALLAEQFPGFQRLRDAKRLTGGASQETWRLTVDSEAGEQTLCLRRNAGAVSAGSVSPRMEAQLMRAAAAAGVPEPTIHYVLETSDGLGEGFLMGWLEGDALGGRIAHSGRFAEIRPRLARQCGEILARLHGIDTDVAGLAEPLPEATPEELVRATWQQYRELGTPQPMLDFTARWLLENLPPPVQPRLVHGDFRNGNLMISPEAGVVGVLDWELAGVGDPVRDLGWICTNSWRFGQAELTVGGFGSLEDLLAGYTEVSGRAVERDHLNFWIVFGSFWWSVCCLLMAHSFRSGENTSVERPAIGRRASEGQADCVSMLLGRVDLPTPATADSLDLPTLTELVDSVETFLASDVAPELSGARGYLARVAANSLGIASRQIRLAPVLEQEERARLSEILGRDGEIGSLRQDLAAALRDGMDLQTRGLARHLCLTVSGQLAIDQPRFVVTPGLPAGGGDCS